MTRPCLQHVRKRISDQAGCGLLIPADCDDRTVRIYITYWVKEPGSPVGEVARKIPEIGDPKELAE